MTHFDEMGRRIGWSEIEFSHRLSPEPTPIVAVSSAIAVHVASRRWLFSRPLHTPHMKATLIIALLLVITACKREPQSTPPRQIAAVSTNGQIEVVKTTRSPVSEWSKVKIGRAGDIYVNKQQMSPAEFATECARLKKVGGAIVLFVDAPDHVASPAQAEVMRKIVKAGVAMEAAPKESDLE